MPNVAFSFQENMPSFSIAMGKHDELSFHSIIFGALEDDIEKREE